MTGSPTTLTQPNVRYNDNPPIAHLLMLEISAIRSLEATRRLKLIGLTHKRRKRKYEDCELDYLRMLIHLVKCICTSY